MKPALKNNLSLNLWFKSYVPVSESQYEGPDVGTEDNDDAVDDDNAGEEAEEEQPEPDEDVDLLVHCTVGWSDLGLVCDFRNWAQTSFVTRRAGATTVWHTRGKQLMQQAATENCLGVYTVRKFNRWRFRSALCDEIFDHFPLFDDTLRHIELCNISLIRRNPTKHL